jgi:hypothetical protein
MADRNLQHERGGDTSGLYHPCKQAGAKQFHIGFPIQIDVLVAETLRRIEDLVSLQSVRFKMTVPALRQCAGR